MRLMNDHGADIRFADIAREMGLSAPALYRYFADRDALLTALMVDGFHEFATQIAAALETAPADDLAARVEAAASAYRRFAAADPRRFSLLFGLPAAGFVSHADGAAVHANVTAMTHLEQLVRSVIDHGVPLSPLVREVGPALASEVPNKQATDGARIPANTYQALLHTLAAIHGFACLETFGHLEWISEQARDELFQAQITLLTQVMGGPSAAD
jgi:AcrR family transcriptional regulator